MFLSGWKSWHTLCLVNCWDLLLTTSQQRFLPWARSDLVCKDLGVSWGKKTNPGETWTFRKLKPCTKVYCINVTAYDTAPKCWDLGFFVSLCQSCNVLGRCCVVHDICWSSKWGLLCLNPEETFVFVPLVLLTVSSVETKMDIQEAGFWHLQIL